MLCFLLQEGMDVPAEEEDDEDEVVGRLQMSASGRSNFSIGISSRD